MDSASNKVGTNNQGVVMLRTAVTFFVLGLVAMLFGAYGIAGVSIEVGKLLLTVFIILAVISFIAGLVTGKPKKLP
jgi:uncharacterized membrane protein YtjA (UPF0391 family)